MLVQKLSGCFPLCSTGALLFIAVAVLPPGRRDALQTEREKYSYADKETLGNCWKFSHVGHKEWPTARFIFFISISVSLTHIVSSSRDPEDLMEAAWL